MGLSGLLFSKISKKRKRALDHSDCSLVFSCKLPKSACSQKFAFAMRSGAMKAPVGLLSDRTVLRSKMEGPRPDKFTLTWLDFCGNLSQQFNITYLLRVPARLPKEPEQVFDFLIAT